MHSGRDGKNRKFARFTLRQRLMHWSFAGSFMGLAFTGFALKYQSSGSVTALFGGVAGLRLVHYCCSALLVAVFLFHLFHDVFPLIWRLFQSRGGHPLQRFRAWWVSVPMLPNKKDFDDLRVLLRYYFKLSPEKPGFDRFSLSHKFGYLAVFWGVPVMLFSGLAMLAPMMLTRFFHGEALHAARLIHGEEAILAVGVIFTWHMYEIRFPFVLRMINGSISEAAMKKHHRLEYDRIMAEELTREPAVLAMEQPGLNLVLAEEDASSNS